MEQKTSTIIIINLIIFISYLKFGTMAIWVPAAIGFSLIVLFVIITVILQVYFIGTYETRFLPLLKRVTGSDFLGTPLSNEKRNILKKGIPLMVFLMAGLAGLIWLVILDFSTIFNK